MVAALVLVALSQSATPYTYREPLAIRQAAFPAAATPIYRTATIDVDLGATFDNPFDPEQVALDAQVVSPSGRQFSMPGYFWQPYRRELKDGKEVLAAEGKARWRVRITPVEAGTHRVTLRLRDRTGTVTREGAFTATAAPGAKGFIRVSPRDRRYFEYANGEAYYPIGANVCWGNDGGTFNFDRWFARYAEQGANYSRLWLSPAWTTFALETSGKAAEGKGLGFIDLGNAWRLEYVLDLAQKHGMALMLCFESYNILRDRDAYNYWESTPHNQDNGGPLRIWSDFWTSPAMDRIFRNKLRYAVARYGGNTGLFSWEFWNEVDLTRDFKIEPVRAWHQRMARALREMDPYAHPITTSYSGSLGYRELDLLPELDYTQTHHYGPDPAGEVVRQQSRKGQYPKPHYVGEIGADAGGPRTGEDRTGMQVKDPMWAAIGTGSSGVAMSWWWDSLIDPQNLYPLFGAVARFVRDIDWPGEQMRQTTPRFEFAVRPAQLPLGDLTFEGGPISWQVSEFNRPRTVRVSRDGVDSTVPLAGIQHGNNHSDKRGPVTFVVDAPTPTVFDVIVGDVSGWGGAALRVELNGKTVVDKDFPDPDGTTSTASLTKYRGTYTMTVPAGQNRVTVSNPGTDWFYVSYRFRKMVAQTGPPIQGWASVGNTKAVAWMRVAGRSWQRVVERKDPPSPAAPSVMTLAGLSSGMWRAEIWDTSKGQPITSASVPVGIDGNARVRIPRLEGDLAVKLLKVSGR